jgi:hypothetical protein
MRLRCEFESPLARSEVDDYVRHLVISIQSFDMDCVEEHVVGKLAMDQILWNDALSDGVPLFNICDNDSQGLHEAHHILTNSNDRFRSNLRIKQTTNHVMFLYGAVFHPSIRPCRQGILDAAFKLFGEESLALMWLETSGLPESALAELGFRKIAFEALIFRHSAKGSLFHDQHPQGQETDVESLPEYEEWVVKEWEKYKEVAEE